MFLINYKTINAVIKVFNLLQCITVFEVECLMLMLAIDNFSSDINLNSMNCFIDKCLSFYFDFRMVQY